MQTFCLAEGGMGVSEIRTNSDIGRGGLIQQPGRPSLKKTRTKNIFVFVE